MFFAEYIQIKHPEIVGNQKIYGCLKNKDNVIFRFCDVLLFDQRKNKYVAKVKSDENGLYEFKNINNKKHKFFIIAHDPSGQYNGVIADNIGGENVDN